MQNKNTKIKTKKKKVVSGNRVVGEMVIYDHPKGIPFPQRYRTTFRVAIQGNIPIGSSPSVYSCYGSSAYLPFAGGSWPGVLVASIATLQPAGYSNLASATGPYQSVRTFGSTARIRMASGTQSDQITFTLTPLITSLGTPAGTSDVLAEARTKSTITVGGAPMKSL